jgi:diguanylate cyclase (GGDEF)-like protein
VQGKTRWELPVVGMTEEKWGAHRATLAAQQPFDDFRFKRSDDAGVLRHISVSGEPFYDENRSFKGYRGIGRDVTDQVLAEERVQFLAYHDNLTTLPNRAAFNLLLNHQVRQARRNKQILAVLFVDLDRFKVINDSLGHDVGDAVLKEVASRLKSSVRNNDTVSRWGGDEFVVLLENVSGATDAALVAQKILDSLNVPSEVLTKDFPVTPSIGISVFPQDGADEEALLKSADLAMYEAKERGRNTYQFYVPALNAEAGLRLQLEAGLRAALDKNEFVVHFQPKVMLSDGVVSGLEALLRWQPPDRELVSPAQFIPLLESTGLIVPVGEWVLRAVCAQIKSWSSTGMDVVPVSVNLSLRQLEHDAFLATTGNILQEYEVDAALIKFEITETMLMRKPDEVVKALTDLAQLGFALSVDDFGTGYSSLGYLKRFPLSELKIDRSFINDVEVNADSAAIVVATIDLAHNLHLKVVAEGVETAAQLLFLRSHGCDEMQGYYFSRPLPIPECTALLQSKTSLDLKALLPTDSTPVVLLVDDSQMDLKLMKRILLPLNCKVVVASSAREAFSVLAQNRVIAIVSDQNMPKVTGVALMSGMRTLYPDVARVLMSGSGGKEALADGVNSAGIHKFLDKSWPPERIRSAMHEVLQGKFRENE